MIRLRLSRRQLRGAGLGLGLAAFLVGCYLLGRGIAPRGGDGRPLLLSPSVRAAEAYRRQALRWLAEMVEVDRGLTALLAQPEVTDPAQLYDLSRAAEELVARATDVARDVVFTSAPPALVSLSEQAQTAAGAHLEAAVATARWVGAPQQEGLRQALEALREARGLRAELAASRWLDGGNSED